MIEEFLKGEKGNESETIYVILPPQAQNSKSIIGRGIYEVKIGNITLNQNSSKSHHYLQYNPKILNVSGSYNVTVKPHLAIFRSQFPGYDDLEDLIKFIDETHGQFRRLNEMATKDYDIIRLSPKNRILQVREFLERIIPERKTQTVNEVVQNLILDPQHYFKKDVSSALKKQFNLDLEKHKNQ